MIGDPSLIKWAELKKFVEEESKSSQPDAKAPKFIEKDKVSFKFKEKGKAAINATGVL